MWPCLWPVWRSAACSVSHCGSRRPADASHRQRRCRARGRCGRHRAVRRIRAPGRLTVSEQLVRGWLPVDRGVGVARVEDRATGRPAPRGARRCGPGRAIALRGLRSRRPSMAFCPNCGVATASPGRRTGHGPRSRCAGPRHVRVSLTARRVSARGGRYSGRRVDADHSRRRSPISARLIVDGRRSGRRSKRTRASLAENGAFSVTLSRRGHRVQSHVQPERGGAGLRRRRYRHPGALR